MTRTYRVTLRYPDGTTMFMGTVHADEIVEIPAKSTPSPDGNPVPPRSASGANGDKGITEKQIKALYAIVRREQRLTENDQIAKWLREHFRVRRLDDIARDTATAFIRQHEPEGGRVPGV